MTGVERTGVIQPGSAQVGPPTRGRMSAAQEAELTLSTRSGQLTVGLIAAIPVLVIGRLRGAKREGHRRLVVSSLHLTVDLGQVCWAWSGLSNLLYLLTEPPT